MSELPAARSHLWLWAFGGLMVYVASCAPVETWYEVHHAPNPVTLHAASNAPTPASTISSHPAPEQVEEPEFQLGKVTYTEAVLKPAWMRYFYAPVHWLADVPLIGAMLSRYRVWCTQVM